MHNEYMTHPPLDARANALISIQYRYLEHTTPDVSERTTASTEAVAQLTPLAPTYNSSLGTARRTFHFILAGKYFSSKMSCFLAMRRSDKIAVESSQTRGPRSSRYAFLAASSSCSSFAEETFESGSTAASGLGLAGSDPIPPAKTGGLNEEMPGAACNNRNQQLPGQLALCE